MRFDYNTTNKLTIKARLMLNLFESFKLDFHIKKIHNFNFKNEYFYEMTSSQNTFCYIAKNRTFYLIPYLRKMDNFFKIFKMSLKFVLNFKYLVNTISPRFIDF